MKVRPHETIKQVGRFPPFFSRHLRFRAQASQKGYFTKTYIRIEAGISAATAPLIFVHVTWTWSPHNSRHGPSGAQSQGPEGKDLQDRRASRVCDDRTGLRLGLLGPIAAASALSQGLQGAGFRLTCQPHDRAHSGRTGTKQDAWSCEKLGVRDHEGLPPRCIGLYQHRAAWCQCSRTGYAITVCPCQQSIE